MAFDWSFYKGNLGWLPERTIYVTKHGSHAYGTNIEGSDLDIRGVCIAPKEYYHGFSKVFEQAESKDPDLVIFEIRKFFRLAADCNPNALEIIFTDPSDHLVTSPASELLFRKRELFLSRKVRHTFQGYAHAQMKRILTHRRWLLNPVTGHPTRPEFGLPERTVIPADQLQAAQSAIRKRLDEWGWKDLEEFDEAARIRIREIFIDRLTEITQWSEAEIDTKTWNAACLSLGYDTNFIELLDRERRYTSKLREYQQYNEWKAKRNPARAELEAQWGFDSKHAMHLVRLSRCCEELLTEGVLHVRRNDAQELLGVRHGAWSFETLVEWFEAQAKKIEVAEKSSPLPRVPNVHALDALCMEIVEAMV